MIIDFEFSDPQATENDIYLICGSSNKIGNWQEANALELAQ